MSRKKRKYFNKKLDFLPVILLIFALVITGALFIVPSMTKPSVAIGCGGYVDEKKLSEVYDPNATVGEFNGKIVQVPPYRSKAIAQVLGESTETNKRIEVDLANQKVFTYEGDSQVHTFTVSTGKWFPTPTGIFTIQRKVTSQTMKGGDKKKGTYYYLPNVPNVMYFGNGQIPWSRGFSFHGTYWHNNFGQPMSHGCVNMRTGDSETLFNWAPMGTKVYIH
ncbi:L,D-transpeptidase [Candidatus Gottesmanbacteria bacterium]|nr:L,D-transpeptidase [Candidatus Gottesmanbacteria bacterium]